MVVFQSVNRRELPHFDYLLIGDFLVSTNFVWLFNSTNMMPMNLDHLTLALIIFLEESYGIMILILLGKFRFNN